MTFETWAIFVPAAFALNCYPGPNNVLAMTHGARFGFATATVAALGRFPAFAAFVLGAAVGLGALLATSAEVFVALKLVGAAYLVWLGVKMLRAGAADLATPTGDVAMKALLRREFLTAVTNPKAMLVFTAFFAPFVDPAEPAAGQILALGAVALALEFVAVVLYAFAGARIGRIARGARGLGIVNRVSGLALVAAGLTMAVASRPATS